jgi:hypothetical protein
MAERAAPHHRSTLLEMAAAWDECAARAEATETRLPQTRTGLRRRLIDCGNALRDNLAKILGHASLTGGLITTAIVVFLRNASRRKMPGSFL